MFSDINISQGSVATPLRCGGICNDLLIANFLLSVTVEEFFLKNVPNSLKYPAEYIAYFFGPPCILLSFRDIAGFLLRRATPLLFHPNFWGVPFRLDYRRCGSKVRRPSWRAVTALRVSRAILFKLSHFISITGLLPMTRLITSNSGLYMTWSYTNSRWYVCLRSEFIARHSRLVFLCCLQFASPRCQLEQMDSVQLKHFAMRLCVQHFVAVSRLLNRE